LYTEIEITFTNFMMVTQLS